MKGEKMKKLTIKKRTIKILASSDDNRNCLHKEYPSSGKRVSSACDRSGSDSASHNCEG